MSSFISLKCELVLGTECRFISGGRPHILTMSFKMVPPVLQRRIYNIASLIPGSLCLPQQSPLARTKSKLKNRILCLEGWENNNV